MKTALTLSMSLVPMMILSGCDLYGYTRAVCNADNAAHLSDLSGTYHLTGQVGGQNEDPVDSTVDASKDGTLAFHSSEEDFTATTCELAGKILAESPATSSTDGITAYILQRQSGGFTLELVQYSVADVSKVMPVKSDITPPSEYAPTGISLHIADNSNVSPADFAAFLQPYTGMQMIFTK